MDDHVKTTMIDTHVLREGESEWGVRWTDSADATAKRRYRRPRGGGARYMY